MIVCANVQCCWSEGSPQCQIFCFGNGSIKKKASQILPLVLCSAAITNVSPPFLIRASLSIFSAKSKELNENHCRTNSKTILMFVLEKIEYFVNIKSSQWRSVFGPKGGLSLMFYPHFPLYHLQSLPYFCVCWNWKFCYYKDVIWQYILMECL